MQPIRVLAAMTGALFVAACVPDPAGSQAPVASLAPLAMAGIAGLPSATGRAGFNTGGMMRELQRQAMLAQQQAEQERLRREREWRTPRVVSAPTNGQLTPVESLRSTLSGNTIRLEAPIMAAGQIIGQEVVPVWLEANGMSHSPHWLGRRWTVEGSALCLHGGAQPDCRAGFTDAAGDTFLKDERNIFLRMTVAGRGDVAQVRQSYAENQRRTREARERQQQVAAFVLGALLSGGGGGGGGAGRDPRDPSDWRNHINDMRMNVPPVPRISH